MNYFLHFFSICLISIFACQKAQSQCASESNVISFTYNGKTYEIVKEKKTWISAAACAVERGGYLVEINDSQEQTAIWEQIQLSGIPTNYNPVNDGGGTSYIWIGATDQTTEGTWLWDGDNNAQGDNFWIGQGNAGAGNGVAVNDKYNNWGGSSTSIRNEPDNYNIQNAAAIALTGWPFGTTNLGIASEWNDIKITNTIYFIVEKDNVSTIENKTNKNINIFPNPIKNNIIISSQIDFENITVRILSVNGQILYEINNMSGNYLNIDLSKFSNGIYILDIQDGKNNLQKKIIKE